MHAEVASEQLSFMAHFDPFVACIFRNPKLFDNLRINKAGTWQKQ